MQPYRQPAEAPLREMHLIDVRRAAERLPASRRGRRITPFRTVRQRFHESPLDAVPGSHEEIEVTGSITTHRAPPVPHSGIVPLISPASRPSPTLGPPP